MAIPVADAVPLKSDAVAERERHLGRERTLKAIAALLGITNASAIVTGVVAIVRYYSGSAEPLIAENFSLVQSVIGLLWNAALCWAAVKLWKLERLGVLALYGWAAGVGFAIYTLQTTDFSAMEDEDAALRMQSVVNAMSIAVSALAAYLLWLALSKKTRRVLSDTYRNEIVEKTPQIDHDLKRGTKAALLLLLLMLLVRAIQNVFGAL